MTGGKPKILIVNENEQDVAHLKQILQDLDCTIQRALNDHEAIEKVLMTHPSLIILNMESESSNGFEMAKIIRDSRKDDLIPMLFLGNDEKKLEGVSGWEATDVLKKPLHAFDVIARCRTLLNMHKYEEDLEVAGQVIESLALAVEARDPTTGNHCDRLFFRLSAMADLMNLDVKIKDTLLKGAVLHDIGKVGVPDRILLKEGPLTDREWEIMRRHVIIGEALCRPLKFLEPVLPLIRHHHERFDGSGYPDALIGEKIPLVARVFQICDVFDALTNPRPYKPAFPKVEAIKILESETVRGWWDPNIAKKFLKLLSQEA